MQSANREIGTQTSVVRERAPRTQSEAGVVGIVTGLPEARTILRAGRPLEVKPAVSGRDFLRKRGLFLDPGGRAVEFEEQRRRLAQRRSCCAG